MKGNISLEKKSGKKKEKDKIFNTFIQLPLDIIQEDAPNALSWGLSALIIYVTLLYWGSLALLCSGMNCFERLQHSTHRDETFVKR